MNQKKQLVALGILVVVAVVVWSGAWNIRTTVEDPISVLQNYKVLAVENPQIHWSELKRAQATEYKSSGRSPFSAAPLPASQQVLQAKAKSAEKPHEDQGPKPLPPTPPPPPAQLPANMKYFGYGTVSNGSPRRAFFTDGDNVYVVPEGDTLLGRFRILKVGNANIEFQEISTGQRGTAILEEPASSPSV